MQKTLALTTCLALFLASPLAAETYVNPDRQWWTDFIAVIEGEAPDFEAMARATPAFLAADEFSREEVLAEEIARLRGDHQQVDPETAEVVMPIQAELGEYSAAQGGFPVSIFAPTSYMDVAGGRGLFFRNWKALNIFPATREEGMALRQRIGAGGVIAEVTVTDIAKSRTRARSYEGSVTKVIYRAQDGGELASITPLEEIAPDPEATAAKLDAVKARILVEVGIPPLGTSWEEAKSKIADDWPLVVSDAFVPVGTGMERAYVRKEGVVKNDAPHDAQKGFSVYLQQVEGDWLPQDGASIDVNDLLYGSGAGVVDTKGLGPGLACYTPDTHDRCAVLIFSPRADGHVMTAAYGVVEQTAAASGEEGFRAFVGDAAGAFEGIATMVDYDSDTLRTADKVQHPGSRGVQAFAAGAGAAISDDPVYDPLKNTVGVERIRRELALYAVEGGEGRMPVLFVMGE